MKQHSFRFVLGIVVSIILGFGVVAGVALSLRADQGIGYESDVTYATKTGPNSATIELGTYPDSNACHPNADAQQSAWVSYCSSTSQTQGTNLEVPPDSIITVVINQYDSSTTLINDYFRQVYGTIGGTMVVNGKTMSQISADAPGHTFTLQSTPDSSYPLFVNVPIPGVASNAPAAVTVNGNQYPKPNIVSFQFRTGPPNSYVWHCYVPCGSNRQAPYGFSGPMSTTGFMAGTLTVANY